ncbi:hypothetical protein TNCV_714291 [Trichonephila clavipes]|nr:hypothetical protein TNCV_714291 [Trichonephila clavipes]
MFMKVAIGDIPHNFGLRSSDEKSQNTLQSSKPRRRQQILHASVPLFDEPLLAPKLEPASRQMPAIVTMSPRDR